MINYPPLPLFNWTMIDRRSDPHTTETFLLFLFFAVAYSQNEEVVKLALTSFTDSDYAVCPKLLACLDRK